MTHDDWWIQDPEQFKKNLKKKFKLEQHDIDSLNEIRRLVAAKSYKSKTIAYEHLSFLEKLANKIKDAIKQDELDGDTTWTLRKDLEKVRRTFEQLYSLIDEMEMKK